MNEKVAQALRETIKVAKDSNDPESEMALHMVRAVMLMGGQREVFELLKPVAERLLEVERPFPAELEP